MACCGAQGRRLFVLDGARERGEERGAGAEAPPAEVKARIEYPKLVKFVPAEYPEAARKERREGVVLLRVDIDENDAWRFRPEARAVASIRGNPQLKTDLTFEYVEAYVVPKRSLTGESTERVDTRVMQVIYSFKRGKLPIYPGQLMDVFIDDLTPRPDQPVHPVEKESKK